MGSQDVLKYIKVKQKKNNSFWLSFRLQRASYPTGHKPFKGELPDAHKKSLVSITGAGHTSRNAAGHKYTTYDIEACDGEQFSQSLPDNNTQDRKLFYCVGRIYIFDCYSCRYTKTCYISSKRESFQKFQSLR